jgi:SAM-dependent methyltransferase
MGLPVRLLGDAPDRSYAAKLERFACFAAPELRRVFADLQPPTRGVALDLGCGTGLATALLAEQMGPGVSVVGLDLSWPHLQAARQQHTLPLVQGDAARLCFRDEVLNFVWCCNAINHLRDGVSGLRALRRHVRKGAPFVLAQSGLLPEMYFAWDSDLDDAVRLACHRYYRDRYSLQGADTAGVRAIVGLMRRAGFEELTVRTYVIERVQPLSEVDRDYFQHAVFEGAWGRRIWPYLAAGDVEKLGRYCAPESPDYCLDRPDFHHVQTLTVCSGR